MRFRRMWLIWVMLAAWAGGQVDTALDSLDPKSEAALEAIQNAALRGDLPLLERLVARGVDPTRQNDQKQTLLFYAAGSGQPSVVRWCLKRGMKADHRDEMGNNALFWAVESQSEAIAKTDRAAVLHALLDAGADPLAEGAFGNLLCDAAGPHGDPAMLDLLLKKGLFKQEHIEAAFATVVLEASQQTLQKLLDAGARVESMNRRGPLLGDVAQRGSIDRVKWLLDLGATVDCRGENQRTPLLDAVSGRSPEMVRLLLDRGADPRLKDDRGDDAFTLIAERLRKGPEDFCDLDRMRLDPELTQDRPKARQIEDMIRQWRRNR